MLQILMPSLKELVNADYASVKNAESEALIAECLKEGKPSKSPELLQVSGIPGSGKSTFCATHAAKGFLYLSFDKIMSQLSGYQTELSRHGAEQAFRKYEMPARIIGYELLRRALNLHLNIMLEHSGCNPAHIELFQNIKKIGYKTTVDFILCDTELAVKRAALREKEINRHVPERLIVERAEKFKQYIAAYRKEAQTVLFFDGADNFRPLNKI